MMITYTKSDNALNLSVLLFYRNKTEQDAKHRNFQYSNREIDSLTKFKKNAGMTETSLHVTRIKIIFLFRNIFIIYYISIIHNIYKYFISTNVTDTSNDSLIFN